MNTYSSTPKAGMAEESASRFESDLAKADTLRASALSGLQQLRTSRANYAQREQTLLAAKLGKDDPEVVRLKTEVAADQRFASGLGAEIDRVNAPIPVVSESGWALYGFVRNQDSKGQPNLTVALFDSSNRWIESLGHTCTDGRGYFQLCFVPGKETVMEPGREIFLRVSNPKRQELYRDKKPMSAVLGEVKYREIILDGETALCPPPSSPQNPAPTTESSVKPSKAKKTRNTKKVPKSKKA
jgi:hypothetical protein